MACYSRRCPQGGGQLGQPPLHGGPSRVILAALCEKGVVAADRLPELALALENDGKVAIRFRIVGLQPECVPERLDCRGALPGACARDAEAVPGLAVGGIECEGALEQSACFGPVAPGGSGLCLGDELPGRRLRRSGGDGAYGLCRYRDGGNRGPRRERRTRGQHRPDRPRQGDGDAGYAGHDQRGARAADVRQGRERIEEYRVRPAPVERAQDIVQSTHGVTIVGLNLPPTTRASASAVRGPTQPSAGSPTMLWNWRTAERKRSSSLAGSGSSR